MPPTWCPLKPGDARALLGTQPQPGLPQVPDGFISHFYSVSEHVSPVLAFGFLGPKPQLAEVCTFFKVPGPGARRVAGMGQGPAGRG